MVKVVILGGGFAGIAAAKALLYNTDRSKVQIVLIDKNFYHLFTPSLYEVASSEEPKKNVCIPLKEILKGVELIKGEVQKIALNEVQLDNKTINYDYLIIALGSETEYHDIPGLKEYSISLKTLEDAVQIRKVISKSLKTSFIREKQKEKSVVQILVGGGGATGCELAAELIHHMGKKVRVSLVQKSPQLVKELNMNASKVAYERLLKADVNICFGERVTKVHENFVETDAGDEHKFDVFIWTGGVCGNSVLKSSGFETNEEGRVSVNQELRIMNYENVFAAGDIAAPKLVKQANSASAEASVPWVAEVAEDEGKLAGENVANLIKGKPLESYKFKSSGFVVPLGGHFAVAQVWNLNITGFFGWLIKQFIFLRYLLSILPITKAFKRWNRFEEYLMKT